MNKEKLIKMLRARLGMLGNSKIYPKEHLEMFLELSAQAFNMIPPVTYDTVDNPDFCDTFGPLLLNYAAYQALASQSLVERGREFKTEDKGVSIEPPEISRLLWEQAAFELVQWQELVPGIKANAYAHMGDDDDEGEEDDEEIDKKIN